MSREGKLHCLSVGFGVVSGRRRACHKRLLSKWLLLVVPFAVPDKPAVPSLLLVVASDARVSDHTVRSHPVPFTLAVAPCVVIASSAAVCWLSL